MESWQLSSLAPSTVKAVDRQPGADAPRVPAGDRPRPQVLFAHEGCRGVVLPILAGGEVGDHCVRERAIISVLSGSCSFEVDGIEHDAPAGTVLDFAPLERHSVTAQEDTVLLLTLVASGGGELHAHEPGFKPRNASASPDSD